MCIRDRNLEGPCPNIAGRDAAFRDDIGRLVSQTRNNICDRRADFYSDDKVIFRIPGTRIDPFSPGHDDDRVSFRDQTVGLSNDTLDLDVYKRQRISCQSIRRTR